MNNKNNKRTKELIRLESMFCLCNENDDDDDGEKYSQNSSAGGLHIFKLHLCYGNVLMTIFRMYIRNAHIYI